MVYVHDGDFEHGSGNTFPGHMLSASQQVVVVTFNYRLGLLGEYEPTNSCCLMEAISNLCWYNVSMEMFIPAKLAMWMWLIMYSVHHECI